MIPRPQIAVHLDGYPDVSSDRPFEDSVTVYWLEEAGRREMFALLTDHEIPQLSLRCDQVLMAKLRAEYETVGPGRKLNRKLWNTILLTGQLSWEEIVDLVDHSYRLVVAVCQAVNDNENPPAQT